MRQHYSPFRMEAKRQALEAIMAKKADPKSAEERLAVLAEVPGAKAGQVLEARGTCVHRPTATWIA